VAIRTPPLWLQAGSHPAENDRLGTQSIIGQSGVRLATDLACTASGFNVVVASGTVYVAGTVTATQGMYQSYNDASVTLPISTAHPTLARIDRVVVTVNDSYYGSASDSAVITLLAGTPSASPVAPSIPANSVSLATVAIAAAATSITNANITDTRTRAASLDYVFRASGAATTPLTIQNNAGTQVASIDYAGTLTAITLSATSVNGTTWSATGGLQLIKKQTVGSAVSSVTVTGAFSATYDDYKIVWEGGSVAGTPCVLYFAFGGVTTNYYSSGSYQSATSAPLTTWNAGPASIWQLNNPGNVLNRYEIDLGNPFLTTAKTMNMRFVGYDNTASAGGQGFGINTNGTSCTAFTLTTSGTSITGGTIYVYGYAKV